MERLKKMRGFAWVLVLAMMLNSFSIPLTTLAAETEASTEMDTQPDLQQESANEDVTQPDQESTSQAETETTAETKPESEAETSVTSQTQETKAAAKGSAREGEIFTPKQYEGADLPTGISVVKEEDESLKTGYYTYESQNPGEKGVIVYGTYAAAEAVDPEAKWYQLKADGTPDTEKAYETQDILVQYINISVDGFTEIALEEEKPDFYGGPDLKEGWGGERYVYSFSDKDDADKTYHRVHGSYGGELGFYVCDENGNVAYPIPVKADLEADKNRAPAEKVIAPELVDDAAFISKLDVVSIIDGTQDWDDNDNPGNDSNDSNKLVRSYDTVIYELEYITSLQNDNYAGFENGQIYVRFELDVDSSEAEFDTQAMSWLNEPVVTYRANGGEYGTVAEARAAGGTITQVLGGYRRLDKPDDLPAVIPGTGTLSAVVKVKAMAGGEEFRPRFILWCKGNEGDPEATNEKGNPEAKKAEAEKVKVSAAPKYNIRLTRNSNTSMKSDFDFSTGSAGAVNSTKGTISGRVFGYNITVQLYNDTATKGLKGIELPQGKITMEVDMKFEASLLGTNNYQDVTNKTFTAGDGDPLNYYDKQGKSYTPMPLLWDYKLASLNQTGNMGRQMQWNENHYTTSPRDTTVSGKGGGRQACYDGGAWNAAQDGSKLTFEVDGYRFADTLERGVTLPSQYYGTTSPEAISYAANIGCFSALSFQVIQPMVEGTDLKQDMDFRLTLENTDMKAKSITGQDMGEQRNKEDDKVGQAVLLKMPGSYDKQIWYRMVGSAGRGPTSTGAGDAWSSLGNKVRFDTKVVIGTANDPEDYAYAQNIFVKFNDKVLEVDAGQNSASFTKASESPGGNKLDYRILYVGRSGGWDDESQIQTAREDDPSLKYFENIDSLTTAGYTCVAFLVEGRGDGKDKINIPGKHGVYTPTLTVKEAATPGYVASAVNDAAVWAKEQYEANGNMIPSRLDVGSGAVMPKARSNMNSSTNSGYNYVKSVYDETGWTGGHSGSYTAGNSLLIVGSKAYINKEVAQLTSGTPKDAFDMGANQRIVDYVLTPQIEVAGGTGTGAAKTTVTITDTLPKGLSYLPDSAYSGGTYEPNANPNKQGTVTGGESLEPDTVEVHSDGAATLTWVLEDITPGDPIPRFTFPVSSAT